MSRGRASSALGVEPCVRTEYAPTTVDSDDLITSDPDLVEEARAFRLKVLNSSLLFAVVAGGLAFQELKVGVFHLKDAEDNLAHLRDEAPEEHTARLHLFLEFAGGSETEVPDPYYGGAAGFERVLDLVEDASRGLLETLSRY